MMSNKKLVALKGAAFHVQIFLRGSSILKISLPLMQSSRRDGDRGGFRDEFKKPSLRGRLAV